MIRPILLSGFTPFGTHTKNPSQQVVEAITKEYQGHVVGRIFPVRVKNFSSLLLQTLQEVKPRAVLALGLGGGEAIALEKVGINLCDFSIPDQDGQLLRDQTIVPEGPCAYFSTLPIREMEKDLRDKGIPVRVSYSAGTYLCNFLLYLLLHTLKKSYPACPGGFVHLPLLPEMAKANEASLPFDKMLAATHLLIKRLEKTNNTDLSQQERHNNT